MAFRIENNAEAYATHGRDVIDGRKIDRPYAMEMQQRILIVDGNGLDATMLSVDGWEDLGNGRIAANQFILQSNGQRAFNPITGEFQFTRVILDATKKTEAPA